MVVSWVGIMGASNGDRGRWDPELSRHARNDVNDVIRRRRCLGQHPAEAENATRESDENNQRSERPYDLKKQCYPWPAWGPNRQALALADHPHRYDGSLRWPHESWEGDRRTDNYGGVPRPIDHRWH